MKFEKYGGRLSAISYICGQIIEIGQGLEWTALQDMSLSECLCDLARMNTISVSIKHVYRI
jgi:hypothetical protein